MSGDEIEKKIKKLETISVNLANLQHEITP